MIEELKVQDLAIIQNVALEFPNGFSVLTGETGAGKSLLIDALELALGGRADSDLVRTGASKCSVNLVVRIDNNPRAHHWLQENGFEAEEHRLYISREVHAEGRSVARINGRAIPISQLRELGTFLVDMHGQHQHQALFHAEFHLAFLDQWIGDEVQPLLIGVQTAFETHTNLLRQAELLKKGLRDREQRLDLLRYQVEEISQFGITVGEEEQLTTTLSRLKNLERIQRSVAAALEAISEGELNARDLLAAGTTAMTDAQKFDSSLSTDDLESALACLDEAIRQLHHYAEQLESDPTLLDELTERWDQLKRLKRKYGETETEILEFLDAAQKELTILENAEANQSNLETQLVESRSILEAKCTALTECRRSNASKFVDQVQEHLADLSMNSAQLHVEMQTILPTANGSDALEFFFSANRGESPKPLTKIASGGEISRVMLAIKSALAGRASVPTLIFDEVDTGLGGRAAAAVGKKIADLGRQYQILCISHLPQVSSQASAQYQIEKVDREDRVVTEIRRLSPDERVREIARMLAGDQITDSTLTNAQELLGQATLQ